MEKEKQSEDSRAKPGGSASANLAKRKLIEQYNQRKQQEAMVTEEEEAQLRGSILQQCLRSHERLQRLSGAQIGRELCTKCLTEASSCLRWDVSSKVTRQQHRHLSPAEQGRLLTNAFNPMSPSGQRLYDMAASGGPLSFPSDAGAREMVNIATEFLYDLCDSQLAQQLPLLFEGASLKPIGGWAQETGLACCKPNLDYLLSMPAWISVNKLCTCSFTGLSSTVAQTGKERLAFESQVHQAAVCALERLVSSVAVAKLQQMEQDKDETAIQLDYDKGISYNPGSDSRNFWSPKRLVLNVICKTSAGQRPCSLRVCFGVPCVLALSHDDDEHEVSSLFGHLQLGLSEPIMLSLSLEEKKRLLSGAESSEHPRLRLVRIVKFLLLAGQQLSLHKAEITKPDQYLSFTVNTIVRDTQYCYELTEEAYYRANFNDRLLEVLEALEATSLDLPYFSVEYSFTTFRKRRLPPSTQRLISFVRRPSSEQEQAPVLLDLLVQFVSGDPDVDKNNLAAQIDAILE